MQFPSGKVVVVGDPSVGKTSIVEKWDGNRFEPTYKTTIGADFKTLRIDDSVAVKLWDTAGCDRFRSLGPMFYRDSDIILLVYDVSNPETFKNIRGWVQQVTLNVNNKPEFWLIGNKCDLGCHIDPKFLDVYCEEIGLDRSYLVSAKTNQGLDTLKKDMGMKVIEKHNERTAILDRVQTVQLNNKMNEQSSGCSC